MVIETIEHAGPTWERLTGQIGWYNAKAKSNQQWYKSLKLLQILLGAAVPVVAAANGDKVILAALGAGVVVIEAIQQLFQFHRNWIAYRATCEALLREQHLCEAGGGEYAAATDRTALLAERLEAIISRETGEWASLETSSQKKPG
jgi:uncharacterized protein DUF4231